jgi:glycosyltransferase involved in cell wall biosynthesis
LSARVPPPDAARPVFLVSDAAHLGGAEASLAAAAARIDRGRYAPHAILPATAGASPLAATLLAEGIPVHPAPMPVLRHGAGPLALLWMLLRTRRTSRRIRAIVASRAKANPSSPVEGYRPGGAAHMQPPPIVDANTLRAALLVAGVPARRPPGAKLMAHHRDRTIPPRLARHLRGRLDAGIGVSAWTSRQLANALPQTPVEAVPPAIDFAPFEDAPPRAEARARLGLGAGARVLVAAGQLAPWKRHDRFLDLLGDLRGEPAPAVGLLAASPARAQSDREADRERGTLRQRARSMGLGDRLRVEAFPPGEMPTVYAAADAVVHLAEGEPFGRVPVEAIATGRAVVAVRGGGYEDLLADSPAATLVEGWDREGIAAAVRERLDAPPPSPAACRAAVAPCEAARVARLMEEIYGRA